MEQKYITVCVLIVLLGSPVEGDDDVWCLTKTYGGAVIFGVGSVVFAPIVLSTAGFGSAGIVAGSFGAPESLHAPVANGGGVASGGFVATLQSAGAAGLGISYNILIGITAYTTTSSIVRHLFHEIKNNYNPGEAEQQSFLCCVMCTMYIFSQLFGSNMSCKYSDETLVKHKIKKDSYLPPWRYNKGDKYGGSVALGAGSIAAAPVVLGAAGFTGSGIAAGSMAARMMAWSAAANGGGVAAGGVVATLQSAGAAGLSLGTKTVIGTGVGVSSTSPLDNQDTAAFVFCCSFIQLYSNSSN
ncbi:Hypothetical predicted protein [Mytilus galloprovincialis]|uniref:Uncharacterized protein n=1 Tax=Mytilus galloprovincialis TaxID=29158 RepID=A0A8B6BR64_MYTGA|nr:Hypothetical predicted protein [Mytilus galloprovincialis]